MQWKYSQRCCFYSPHTPTCHASQSQLALCQDVLVARLMINDPTELVNKLVFECAAAVAELMKS